MASEQGPVAAPAPPDAAKRRRRLYGKPLLLGLVLLALCTSLACNFLLYQRARKDYRNLAELQLDPYGLKHPDFPIEPPAGDAASELPRVVFFGDSRARQWPAPPVRGWRFVNRGAGGQTTEQLRGRFEAHVPPLAPRVVIVQGGINDLKAIPLLPARGNEIVADCKANLRHLVSRASAGGAIVIITTIFPSGPVPLERRTVWSPEIGRAVEEVNAELRGLASDRVLVLDAWNLLSQDGRLRDGYGADTLHLTGRGYEVLNAELSKMLSALPPGGAH